MELRDNIAERRRAAGLTQEDVASRLGVSRQTVGKWEAGRAIPELEKLVALCDLFGCTLDEIVGKARLESASEKETASLEAGAPFALAETNGADANALELLDEAPHAPSGTATRYATTLAAGIWLIAASVGLLSLLLGPSSVDNVEVRRIVPYAVALGAGFGVVLVIASRFYRSGSMQSRATTAAAARRCRMAAVPILLAIAAAICALVAFSPDMRATTFICVEMLALAAWPIVFAAVFTVDSRK